VGSCAITGQSNDASETVRGGADLCDNDRPGPRRTAATAEDRTVPEWVSRKWRLLRADLGAFAGGGAEGRTMPERVHAIR
jgi:hypothetical protein